MGFSTRASQVVVEKRRQKASSEALSGKARKTRCLAVGLEVLVTNQMQQSFTFRKLDCLAMVFK